MMVGQNITDVLPDEPGYPTVPLPHAARLGMPNRLRVAVLDPDSALFAALSEGMEHSGWKSYPLGAAVSPWALVRMKLHVLVVDPVALDGNPMAWLCTVREVLPDLRIVVCTGPSPLSERVSALRTVVDEWVTKPCAPIELLARIESVARGPQHMEPAFEPPILAGELIVSPDHHQAFAHGVSAQLTRREFSMLHLLASEDGRVIDRSVAYSHIWGHPMVKRDRSVDVHVRRIRGKLARISPGWSYIHTHYRVGYRFRALSDKALADAA
jgi:DNA-binding response OmpR family regulator